MTVGFHIRDDGLLDLADEVEEETIPLLKAAMDECSEIVLEEAQRLLNRRSGPGPAPEGEPPARQRGDLLRSLKTVATRIKGTVVRGGIRTLDPGAPTLEFGGVILARSAIAGKTTYRKKVLKAEAKAAGTARLRRPRPFLRPAEEAAQPKITSHLESVL